MANWSARRSRKSWRSSFRNSQEGVRDRLASSRFGRVPSSDGVPPSPLTAIRSKFHAIFNNLRRFPRLQVITNQYFTCKSNESNVLRIIRKMLNPNELEVE